MKKRTESKWLRTKKTKEELGEELNRAITEAKAQYNSTVKPAQEKTKLKEQQARILLEQTTKLYEKSSQIIGFNETKSPITGKVAQTPSEIIYLESDEVQQYQSIIDAAEDAYRKVRENTMSDYYKIEKPAKAEKDVAIRLANQHYDEALKELRKVDDWFEYRRTYQRSLRLDTHEEIKAMKAAPECSVDIACTGPQSTLTRLKCHFCGDSKARTEAGLNQVKYRLKHPGAGFWSTLLGRNWKYACQDCVDYMIHLWGNVEMKPVGLPVVDRDLDHQKMVAEEKEKQ